MTQENQSVNKFIQFQGEHPKVFPCIAVRLRESTPLS
jgi:hypothetical protein